MIIFKDEYSDKFGNKYNIRNVNLSDKSDLYEIGKYITETKRNNGFWNDSNNLEDGVYIYKSNFDSNKAFRIYKDFALYKYTYHSDAKDVSKLQEFQKNVKLTEFPTGIITIEGSVIGQEIPFYENYETLYEKIHNLKDIRDIFYYYNEIIKILEELASVGIIYNDLHAKNFMVKEKLIKLIDFGNDAYMYSDNIKFLLGNLKSMINYINEKLKLDFKVNSESIDGLKEEIMIKSKKYM